MAQECGFFNAQLVGEEYDRVYLAEQFAAYFASFIGNGVFGSSMQQLKVLARDTANMSVKVGSGQAWINGWWYRNTDAYTLDIDVADGALSRIDLIVLRWGQTERDMWLQVIKGTPSVNPVAPSISRGADYYDLQLATVSIPAGAIKITQAQITDTRLDNNVCGLVTGVVDQIDTTDLYNQFESYFDEFKQLSESEFDSWFEDVKGTLGSDAAGNLKNQIDAANEKIGTNANNIATNTSAIDTLNNNSIKNLKNQINAANEKIETNASAISDNQMAINTLNNSSIKKLTKKYTSTDTGIVYTEIPLTTQCIAVFPSQERYADNPIYFSLYKGSINRWLVSCYYLQDGNVHMVSNYTVTLDIYYIGTIT